MAEKNDVIIDVKVTGDKSLSDASASLKKYRQELKEAQSAALNGDGKAAKRVAELKDKMDDLRDATKTLQGSGVEKVSNSFGLLGEGLRNLDLDKVGTGFRGMGAAMKALPIFLIVEGISLLIDGVKYLVENFDELSKGDGVLAKSLRAVNDWFQGVKDGFNATTDALGLTNTALEKQGDAIAENAAKGKEALDSQNAAYDRQIAVAKAAGKSTVELEKAKQQAIIDTNVAVAKQIEAFVRAGGTLDEEKKKLLTASLEAIRNAKTQETVIELTDQKTKNENYKKHLQEQMDAYNKAIDDRKKAEEEFLRYEQYLNTIRVDFFKAAGVEKKAIEDADIIAQQENQDINTEIFEQSLEKRKKSLRVFLKENQEAIKETGELTALSLQSTQNLSDLVFSIKMANLKKGSAEEEKAAKRQFEINKGLQIAQAAINGAQSVTAILAVPDFTLGVASAIRIAAAITATAATIAKIASTQFQPSGGASGGGGAPTIPQVNTGNIQTQAPSAFTPPTNQTTTLNEQAEVVGRQTRAYVVETDITDKQNRVNRLESQATF